MAPTPTTPRWQEYRRLDELPPAMRNPKGHDEDGIAASMTRFGYIEAAVLDERTGLLLGGHGRKKVLEDRRAAGDPPPEGVLVDDADGMWLIPLDRGWRSRNDAEAEAALIAVNRLVEVGGYDQPNVLAEMLDAISSTDDGLAGTGYTAEELTDLLASLHEPAFEPQPADAQPRLDEREPITCPSCGHQFPRP